MAVRPVGIERFGGWDTRGDLYEVPAGAAAAALNVWLEDGSKVKRRPAASTVQTIATTENKLVHVVKLYDNHYVYYSDGSTIKEAGTTRGTFSISGPAVQMVTMFDDFCLACNGEGRPMYKQVGNLAWSNCPGTVANMEGALLCAYWKDRAVIARIKPTAGRVDGANEYTVRFSNPQGDGFVWPNFSAAADYVDVGTRASIISGREGLTAMHAYRDKLLVFERNRLHVFYSISTDSVGGAVFNYRTIDNIHGPDNPRVATVTTHGVLWLDDLGRCWLSSGGTPQRVFRHLDGLVEQRLLALNPLLAISNNHADEPRMLTASGGFVALMYCEHGAQDYGRVLVMNDDGSGCVEWTLSVPFAFSAGAPLSAYSNGCIHLAQGLAGSRRPYLLYSRRTTPACVAAVELGGTPAADGALDAGLAGGWTSEYVPGGQLPGEGAGPITVRRALIRATATPTFSRWYTDDARTTKQSLRALQAAASGDLDSDFDPIRGQDLVGLYAQDQAARGRRVRLGIDPGTGAVHGLELHVEALRTPGEGHATPTDAAS